MNPDDLRNWLSSAASDLRRSKLLPVLILLIAAAVAIPLLVSHSGKAATLSPLPPAPTVTAPDPATAVSVATGRRHEPKQNYLTGPSHNPFVAKTITTATTTGSKTTASNGSADTSTTAPTSAGTSSVATAPADTVTVSAPAATKTVSQTTTVPAKLRYSNYQVEVSLLQTGAASAPTVFHNLSRDQLLPADDDSFAAFLGVRTDKATAVFVLPDDATVTGAGDCAPSATACTFLTLTPGQRVTVVFTPSDGAASTYALRYLKVLKVASSQSIVTVDQAGAAEVKQASGYVSPLKGISYAPYTGLLTIALGSTVPVTP